MSEDAVIHELLEFGLDDWVPVHDVVVLGSGGSITSESKARILRILDRLYLEGLMTPGELGESGFEDWPSSRNEWIIRSEVELEKLEWRPMGAGFWLKLTVRGEQVARQGHL